MNWYKTSNFNHAKCVNSAIMVLCPKPNHGDTYDFFKLVFIPTHTIKGMGSKTGSGLKWTQTEDSELIRLVEMHKEQRRNSSTLTTTTTSDNSQQNQQHQLASHEWSEIAKQTSGTRSSKQVYK